ncbi:MAG: hypothetical protein OEZ23_07470 [Gammaproteobacteria bacterium]|nr:hypothetical protein [Gammaproteobacteria bacterium]
MLSGTQGFKFTAGLVLTVSLLVTALHLSQHDPLQNEAKSLNECQICQLNNFFGLDSHTGLSVDSVSLFVPIASEITDEKAIDSFYLLALVRAPPVV